MDFEMVQIFSQTIHIYIYIIYGQMTDMYNDFRKYFRVYFLIGPKSHIWSSTLIKIRSKLIEFFQEMGEIVQKYLPVKHPKPQISTYCDFSLYSISNSNCNKIPTYKKSKSGNEKVFTSTPTT